MSSLFNTESMYSPLSRFFHWLVFAFVFTMLLGSYFMDDITDKVLKGSVVNAHKLLGLTILALMVLRLLWTMINRKPASFPGTKKWECWAEHFVHRMLYFLLIAMPISGWVGSVSKGRSPRWGHIIFSLPLQKNETLIDFSFTAHSILAYMIIALVSVHILAALYHYFIRQDNVLQRILP